MMNLLFYIMVIGIGLVVVLALLYLFLMFKLKNINNKIYRYKETKNLKDKNILIIYQPSRHKTISKIVNLIENKVSEKGYGTKIHTLTRNDENYDLYKYVIFVVPVYFAEVNNELINKVKNHKFNKLIVIYNGLNKDSNNEDKSVKKNSINKYSKIKLNTQNIENVNDFIDKEVL